MIGPIRSGAQWAQATFRWYLYYVELQLFATHGLVWDLTTAEFYDYVAECQAQHLTPAVCARQALTREWEESKHGSGNRWW